MQVDHMLSSDEFWAQYAEFENRMRESFDQSPVFQISGWTGQRLLSEWEYTGAARAVVHRSADREITVRTSDGDPEWAVRQQWMHAILSESAGSRDLSRFALRPPVGVAIRVDDREENGRLWQGDRHWYLGFRYEDFTVLAHGPGEHSALLSLERLTDLEPLLAGRRRDIQEQRRNHGLD